MKLYNIIKLFFIYSLILIYQSFKPQNKVSENISETFSNFSYLNLSWSLSWNNEWLWL